MKPVDTHWKDPLKVAPPAVLDKRNPMGKKITSQITKPTLPLATLPIASAPMFRRACSECVIFELRCKGTQICLYAWDIALFPDATMREQQVEQLWQTCEPLTPEQASQDMAASFTRDVRTLVAPQARAVAGHDHLR